MVDEIYLVDAIAEIGVRKTLEFRPAVSSTVMFVTNDII